MGWLGVLVALLKAVPVPGALAGDGGLCVWWVWRRVGDDAALAALAASATLP